MILSVLHAVHLVQLAVEMHILVYHVMGNIAYMEIVAFKLVPSDIMKLVITVNYAQLDAVHALEVPVIVKIVILNIICMEILVDKLALQDIMELVIYVMHVQQGVALAHPVVFAQLAHNHMFCKEKFVLKYLALQEQFLHQLVSAAIAGVVCHDVLIMFQFFKEID